MKNNPALHTRLQPLRAELGVSYAIGKTTFGQDMDFVPREYLQSKALKQLSLILQEWFTRNTGASTLS